MLIHHSVRIFFFFNATEEASSLLINLEVRVRNLAECNTLYSAAQEIFTIHYPRGLDDTILCANGDNGNDVCRVSAGGRGRRREREGEGERRMKGK